MAVPASDRKVIPPHFIAYLDKYRIYELFYDMASSLAMHMPDDHLLYLRNYLVDAASNRGRARIAIIGPPFIDKKSIAKALGFLLKLPIISLCDVTNGDQKYYENPELLASKFKEFLYGHEMQDKGWILYDFPRNRSEVSALQKVGIRASHAFQLIPSPQNVAERELWDERYVGKPVKELAKYMKEYRRRLNGLRPALKNILKEVPLHGRSLETIVKNLAILGRQSTHSGGPMLPRVVLIGTRGSFKRTIACIMAQQMGVVHIHMEELIEQALQKDNELGRELKELASRNIRLYGKLVVAVLEDRLLDYDCLNKGWVLTGFPRDDKDLAVLDMFDTPPNRVIFITNNSLEALSRITNRRVNIFTGEYKHLDEVTQIEDVVAREQFVIHPDDELMRVMQEQKEFDDNVQGMLDYCKGNCIIVDGTGGLDSVMQRVFKATLQATTPESLTTGNTENVVEENDQIEEDANEELKPVKSIIARGKSKSNVKVAFGGGQSISRSTGITQQATTIVANEQSKDTMKPTCIETSLSRMQSKSTLPVGLKKPGDLPTYESCTSVFPCVIQTEWGRVRNRIKSYTSLPSVKTRKSLK